MMQSIKIRSLLVQEQAKNMIAKHAGDLGNSFKTSICVATRANTQVQDNIVSLSSNTDIQLTGTFTLHLMELFLQQHLLKSRW